MNTPQIFPGKLIAPTQEAEVLGAGLLPLKEAINYEHYADQLAAYGLDEIEQQQWYPLQLLLDMYTDMIERSPGAAMQNLISIGMKVVDVMPKTCTTIPEAVQTLNALSQQMMRGFDVVDFGYRVDIIEDKHVQVVEYSPFPHDLIYGYLYAIGRKYGPKSSYPIVERTYLNPDDTNSDGALYDITW